MELMGLMGVCLGSCREGEDRARGGILFWGSLDLSINVIFALPKRVYDLSLRSEPSKLDSSCGESTQDKLLLLHAKRSPTANDLFMHETMHPHLSLECVSFPFSSQKHKRAVATELDDNIPTSDGLRPKSQQTIGSHEETCSVASVLGVIHRNR